MENYHYEWFVYTDNLTYGRMLLGHVENRKMAERIGQMACKGCYFLEKHIVIDKHGQ